MPCSWGWVRSPYISGKSNNGTVDGSGPPFGRLWVRTMHGGAGRLWEADAKHSALFAMSAPASVSESAVSGLAPNSASGPPVANSSLQSATGSPLLTQKAIKLSLGRSSLW